MEFSRELHTKTIRSAAILTTSHVAADLSTTLNGDLESGAGAIPVTDASSFPSAGTGVIDAAGTADVIQWTSISGNTLQGVTGVDSSHSNTDTFDVPLLGNLDAYNFLGILLDFTKGSLTTMELKIEGSMDGLNYYQQIAENTTSGTTAVNAVEYQFDASGSFLIMVNPIRAKYIRISVKGTGTVTSSSCALTAVWGWA